MAKLEVLNWDKKKVGEVDMPADVIEREVKPEVLHTLVRWQLMSRRQGTHKTKTRSEVSGGGKKPFKQKGTGNARQGSSRSPLMPGGAILFGPRPRDYSYNLPKSLKQAGLKIALSYLYKEGRLFIIDDMSSKEGKTNELASRLKKFGLEKALLVSTDKNEMFTRAAKNLGKFRYNSVSGVNVFDLLKYNAVVFTKDSIPTVVEKCGAK